MNVHFYVLRIEIIFIHILGRRSENYSYSTGQRIRENSAPSSDIYWK